MSTDRYLNHHYLVYIVPHMHRRDWDNISCPSTALLASASYIPPPLNDDGRCPPSLCMPYRNGGGSALDGLDFALHVTPDIVPMCSWLVFGE